MGTLLRADAQSLEKTHSINKIQSQQTTESKLKMLPLILLLMSSILPSFRCSYSPEETIANIAKATLVNLTNTQVSKMMKKHLQHLQLFDEVDGWAHPKLKSIRRYLLPRKVDGSDLAKLVDVMARNAGRNKYLRYFLARAKSQDFPDLALKVKQEGATKLPDIVAYAMLLNRLVKAMRKNNDVLQACHEIWTNLLNPWNSFTGLWRQKRSAEPAFSVAKSMAVAHVIEDFLEMVQTNNVHPDFGSYHLPFNIMLAKALDISRGNLNNAKVAVTLASQTIGGETNNCTGAGPTQFSDDGNAIEFNIAFALQWTDLYQTWNMAFVTNFETWPYLLVKLLIPIVSDYHKNPRAFLYNRVLGLYIHLMRGWMEVLYDDKATSFDIDWYSSSLSKRWGLANYRSSKDYESLLATCSDK